MAATATAPGRTKRARATRTKSRSTARRRPTQRRRGITPATGFAIPAAAVGKTAVAVGGIADSGIVVRLTRSRLWIGLVGALLVGIVALNVYSLSLSASGSRTAQQAEELALENSAMRAQLAERLSADEIHRAAGKLGLANPTPDAIRYLRASEGDAQAAAKRLLGGDLAAAGSGTASAEAAVAATETETTPPAPVATETTAPAPATTTPAPVAPEPAPVADPAAATTAPPPVTP
jgi:cell division septation protein DedD